MNVERTMTKLKPLLVCMIVVLFSMIMIKGNTVTTEAYAEFTFDDVQNESAFYYNPVYWAVDKKITSGMTETLFVPEATVTRGQMVTFLYRVAGCPDVEIDDTFIDLGENEVFRKSISWASANGITKGTTDTTFSPDAPCTRGQIMTFLYRMNGSPEVEVNGVFEDVAEESPFLNAIYWGVSQNVTLGMTDTTFAPNDPCLRAHAVTFLYRYYEGARYIGEKALLVGQLEDLQDEYDNAGKSFIESNTDFTFDKLIAFYLRYAPSLQAYYDQDAINASISTATSIENLKKSVNMVKKTNELRAKETEQPIPSAKQNLKIGYFITEYAIIANAFNTTMYSQLGISGIHQFVTESSQSYRVSEGENWVGTDSIDMAYRMWYTDELYAYQNETGAETGHYENLINPEWKITGVGCDGMATQEFSQDGANSVTPTEFISLLDQYVAAIQKKIDDKEAEIDALIALSIPPKNVDITTPVTP